MRSPRSERSEPAATEGGQQPAPARSQKSENGHAPRGKRVATILTSLGIGVTTAVFTIGGSWAAPVTWTGSGAPERVQNVTATASIVDVLGVAPSQGRWFTESEDQPGATKVAVVSHRFWQTQLAGAGDVFGRSLTLNGQPRQVIGVMPEGFAYPLGDASGDGCAAIAIGATPCP